MQALQMRIHGDFQLEHVLYTGKDFVIVDFEGEPGKTVSERRLKRLPLVDVACMIRSFHYAVAGALAQHLEAFATSAENVEVLERAGRDWFQGTTAAFLKSYLAAAAGQSFLPSSHGTLQVLLHMLLLRRSMIELNFELMNRIAWSPVPLRGLLKLLTMKPGDDGSV
jgi:maltose alpha-D-glucosyltransferase/alpha-amylase